MPVLVWALATCQERPSEPNPGTLTGAGPGPVPTGVTSTVEIIYGQNWYTKSLDEAKRRLKFTPMLPKVLPPGVGPAPAFTPAFGDDGNSVSISYTGKDFSLQLMEAIPCPDQEGVASPGYRETRLTIKGVTVLFFEPDPARGFAKKYTRAEFCFRDLAYDVSGDITP